MWIIVDSGKNVRVLLCGHVSIVISRESLLSPTKEQRERSLSNIIFFWYLPNLIESNDSIHLTVNIIKHSKISI